MRLSVRRAFMKSSIHSTSTIKQEHKTWTHQSEHWRNAHSARTLISKCKERITAFIPSTTRNATCHTFGDHPLQSSPLKYSTPLPVPFFITLLHSQVLRVCQSWVCYDHTMRHRNKGRTSHSHNMTHMFWLLFQSCGGYIRNRDTVQ